MRVWAIKILTCKTRCWDSGTEMMVQLLNNLLEVINSSFHYDIMTRIIHLSIWKGVLRKIHEPNQKRSHIHMKEYAAACNQCAELQRSGNIMQIFGVLIHTDYMLVVEPTTFVWDFFFEATFTIWPLNCGIELRCNEAIRSKIHNKVQRHEKKNCVSSMNLLWAFVFKEKTVKALCYF